MATDGPTDLKSQASEVSPLTPNYRNYDARNELTSQTSSVTGTTSYAYDPNGSQTDDGAHKYVYDLRDKLTGVTDESGNVIAAYVYDDAGNRVQESVASGGTTTTSYYLTDANNPTGYAQPIEQWVSTSGSRTNATLAMSYIIGDRVLAQVDGSANETYLLTDGHGSTRLLTDSAATVTAAFNYDAFGGAIGFNPATAPTIFLFGGDAVYDPASGLYLHGDGTRAREGFRFIQPDPTDGHNEDPLSLHKYLYANADPISGTDPTGHDDLVEEEAVTADLAELSNMTTRVIKTLGQVQHWVGFLHDLEVVISEINSHGLQALVADGIRNMRQSVTKLSAKVILQNLEDNLPHIVADVLPYWGGEIAVHFALVDRLLIYLPVPIPMPIFEVPTYIKLPRTNLPVKLVFGAGGAKWGRIVGMGVGLNTGERKQMWRMDFHPVHEDKGKDLDFWPDGIFHYHVSPWDPGEL